jgi:amino-acid N-acetyltransferase
MIAETKDPALETPADKCIDAFGGVRSLARALERNPSSVVRWRKPKDEGGSNGAVPSALQGRILAIAQARGLNLTAEDLILRTSKDWSL